MTGNRRCAGVALLFLLAVLTNACHDPADGSGPGATTDAVVFTDWSAVDDGCGVDHPRGLELGPDGMIWLANHGADPHQGPGDRPRSIVRVDPADGLPAGAPCAIPIAETYDPPGPTGPLDLTDPPPRFPRSARGAALVTRLPGSSWGADDDMWFTMNELSVIGRIDVAHGNEVTLRYDTAPGEGHTTDQTRGIIDRAISVQQVPLPVPGGALPAGTDVDAYWANLADWTTGGRTYGTIARIDLADPDCLHGTAQATAEGRACDTQVYRHVGLRGVLSVTGRSGHPDELWAMVPGTSNSRTPAGANVSCTVAPATCRTPPGRQAAGRYLSLIARISLADEVDGCEGLAAPTTGVHVQTIPDCRITYYRMEATDAGRPLDVALGLAWSPDGDQGWFSNYGGPDDDGLARSAIGRITFGDGPGCSAHGHDGDPGGGTDLPADARSDLWDDPVCAIETFRADDPDAVSRPIGIVYDTVLDTGRVWWINDHSHAVGSLDPTSTAPASTIRSVPWAKEGCTSGASDLPLAVASTGQFFFTSYSCDLLGRFDP